MVKNIIVRKCQEYSRKKATMGLVGKEVYHPPKAGKARRYGDKTRLTGSRGIRLC